MALNWADGFDHYGGVTARLLDRVYAQIEGVSLSTARPRTGAYSMRVQVINNDSGARRVLPTEADNVGVAFAFNITQLPTNSTSLALCQFLSKTNVTLATIQVLPTGAVTVRQGGWQSAIVAESGPEVIMPGSYQHFEVAVDGSNLEIRINGVTYLNMTSLALPANIAQVFVAGCYGYPKTGAADIIMDVDDLVCWNKAGSFTNTWIGDKKVYLEMPDEDGPDQDWTPSVGSEAWPILDNIPPIDTQFLTALSPAEKVSVGIAPFGSDIVSISAVYVAARTWKTDAGNAKISIDMVSGGDASVPVSIPVTSAPVWYGRAFDVDPSTGMPWTVAGINAALVRIERIE